MSDVGIRVTGLSLIEANLGQAPEIVGDELARMVDRLTILGSTESKRAVGVKTGHLRRSIAHEPARRDGTSARGLWGTNVPYARYHNDGTDPHDIVPRQAKALAWRGGPIFGPVARGVGRKGGIIFARIVHHPGTKARKFMETGRDLVRGRIRSEASAAAKRIAARLTGGAR